MLAMGINSIYNIIHEMKKKKMQESITLESHETGM
jgi:hypothetical protein